MVILAHCSPSARALKIVVFIIDPSSLMLTGEIGVAKVTDISISYVLTSLCLSIQAEIQTRSDYPSRCYAPLRPAFRAQSQVQAAWGGSTRREPIYPDHAWRLGQFSDGEQHTQRV